jgi:hypothetical protein
LLWFYCNDGYDNDGVICHDIVIINSIADAAAAADAAADIHHYH